MTGTASATLRFPFRICVSMSNLRSNLSGAGSKQSLQGPGSPWKKTIRSIFFFLHKASGTLIEQPVDCFFPAMSLYWGRARLGAATSQWPACVGGAVQIGGGGAFFWTCSSNGPSDGPPDDGAHAGRSPDDGPRTDSGPAGGPHSDDSASGSHSDDSASGCQLSSGPSDSSEVSNSCCGCAG